MPARETTVFGGTGFLGSAIVMALRRAGHSVRVAVRRPERVSADDHDDTITVVQADVRDPDLIEAALDGSTAVVNAVGLYVEKGADTFESVHVGGAGNVARLAARAGVSRLVHVSGIGVSVTSESSYVRARADGERAVTAHFPDATMVRPSVIFGPGDSFLRALDDITRLLPVIPLFGRGDTRMQPVYVEDVALAVIRLLESSTTRAKVCELGGPRVYTYREVIAAVLAYRGRRRLLLPLSFEVWSLLAKCLALLPNPPLTRDQVVLMHDDNVVGEGVTTFADLGMTSRDLRALLPECLVPGPRNA